VSSITGKVTASCINGSAIVPFYLAGVIVWHQAILMAIGASLGSYSIAQYARKLDPKLVRKFAIVIAFTMTGYFIIRA
jgi:uncharacterized protein